ncbi:two-component system response regulator [Snodgrassella communis]|uniref:Acetoacetate metabolism regulatory protein AtoC n=1 Tax=Snodgrassella communis TaxID=2946699 RepID=A0A066TFJ8_9NEIS|nr:sigma-54-dependent Fis family transcriptional regulator [Snodgrassella communis]KDN11496.1 Acetoacetate metabolism regulatory protein AtoC [Snodgrassella communis]KDN13891.1 Acetoacetate metabolism regulatory protein AtoC [Snodgrassella communis]PIT11204.1 two-component system response regulator [Snodgrassella communis]PIT27509.1 two-component system response regulator [Snodgrassella communis]PIT30436.1 two-component system response regulator [Snodgrassella communis]
MSEKILIVEDELNLRKLLSIFLTQQQYQVIAVDNAEEAIELLAQQPIDLILMDNRLPQMTGLEALKIIKEIHPEMFIILMTAYAGVDTAVEALKLGAIDYIVKPFDLNELKALIKRTLELSKAKKQGIDLSPKIQLSNSDNQGHILTNSPNMMELCRNIAKISQTKTTVLITGESGTGKELVAKTIHYYSTRSTGPFIKVNCGALPETLLESTLFGHEKGSFTGAYQRQIGLFERAHRGTLFLDEVAEMSTNLQVKLLRVIQEREFEPLGGSRLIKTDFRLIAATNRSLQDMISTGEFREDLFYRLNVMELSLPPLRNRKNDVMLLARYFANQFCHENNKELLDFSISAVEVLNQYAWPGNVRELSNAIEHAVVMSNGLFIYPQDLPAHIIAHKKTPDFNPDFSEDEQSSTTLKEKVKIYEKELIINELKLNRGHRENTARSLGISKRTLLYKMQEYEIAETIN